MGAAIANRFSREGFSIALLARDASRLEELAEPIRRLGGVARTSSVDLCELAAVRETFKALQRDLGDADVLVYNGARWHETPAMAMDPLTFNWDLALCATGALACSQQVYPAMRNRGSGTILFTGGGLALKPEFGAGVASLSAGKAALRALAYAMAAELKNDNVHVATVTIAGTVQPGTLFDPDKIAERYWQLHQEIPALWRTEDIFLGA